MTLPSLVLGIPLISLPIDHARPFSDHSIALAHPARRLLESLATVREGEGYLVAPKRAGSPARFGDCYWLMSQRPVPEGTQAAASPAYWARA